MTGKKILIAILARDKEATLPLYLECLVNLDYDKKDISLYIRTNDNADGTEAILRSFIENNKNLYERIIFNNASVAQNLTTHHNWNRERFSVLGKIRKESLQAAADLKCEYYFVIDCDNFILPHTLKKLMRFDVPIIAPFLVTDEGTYYSNFHYEVDTNGYLEEDDRYYHIFSRAIKGIFQVKVVHCTYLIRAEYLDKLYYEDGSGRYEYVIFSDSARKNNISQYIDNTEMYGLITFKTKSEEMADLNLNSIEKYIKMYAAFLVK